MNYVGVVPTSRHKASMTRPAKKASGPPSAPNMPVLILHSTFLE